MSNFKNKMVSFLKGETLFSSAMTALFIGLVIVANVIIYAVTSYFGLYLYTEKREDLSLSGYTDTLFEDAIDRGEKVKIIFCQSDEEVLANSMGSRVLTTAKHYEERYPDFIEIEYLNIITKRNNKGEAVDLSKYVKKSDGTTNSLLESSVIFESKYDHRILTDYYSNTGYSPFYTVSASGYSVAYNGEEVIAAMVMWTLAKEHRSVYFTTYHGEVADTGFNNMLVCAGYDVHTIDLKKNDVPEDADMVIISNPQKDFEKGSSIRTEIERLRSYLDLGGRLFVTIDPYVKSLPVLENFLGEYGITVSSSSYESGQLRNIVRDSDNAITSDFFTFAATAADSALGSSVNDTVEAYTDASVIVKTTAALELSGNAEPLLLSSSSSTLYAGGKEVDGDGGYCIAAASLFDTENGKGGAVVVVPSVFIIATDALVTEGYANRAFLYSVFDNLFSAESIPYGCKTVYFADQILENLNMKTARIYTAIALAIPVAIGAFGAVVIVRRKNR